MYVLRRITPLTVALLAVLLALAFGALAMFGGTRAQATHVQPTLQLGNFNCAQITGLPAGTKELRVEPVADGTFTDGTLSVTIDVRNTGAGQVFDFTANQTIVAVAVKGGPNTNIYNYSPGGATQDTGLHAPAASNGRWSGLSHISFCYVESGSVKIIKTDDATPPNPLAGAEFTLFQGTTNTGLKCTTAANGECTISNVPPGEYTLKETVVPAGHNAVPDRTVTVTSGQTVTVGPLADLRERGAIAITKTAKHFDTSGNTSPNLVAGFTIQDSSGNTVATPETDANGEACVDGLLPGDYTVVESNVPAGYNGDTSKSVTVSGEATCQDDPYNGQAVSFTNKPLSNITVSFESQVPGGTAATIDCEDLTATPEDSTPDDFDDTSETFEDLEEGTYTCTVVIDP